MLNLVALNGNSQCTIQRGLDASKGGHHKAENQNQQPVFTDDVTADTSSRILCIELLSARIQSNAAKRIRQHFTVQMNNDAKHRTKATQKLPKPKIQNVLKWPHKSHYLNSTEHAFHLLNKKLLTDKQQLSRRLL